MALLVLSFPLALKTLAQSPRLTQLHPGRHTNMPSGWHGRALSPELVCSTVFTHISKNLLLGNDPCAFTHPKPYKVSFHEANSVLLRKNILPSKPCGVDFAHPKVEIKSKGKEKTGSSYSNQGASGY